MGLEMKNIVNCLSYRVRMSIVIVLVAIIPLILLGNVYLRNEQISWREDAMMEYSNVIAINSERLNNVILEMKQKCIYITNNMIVSNALTKIEQQTMVEALELIILLRDTVEMVSADNVNMRIHWYSDKTEKQYAEYYRPIEVLVQEFQDNNVMQQILQLKPGEFFVLLRNKESYAQEVVSYICVYAKMNDLEEDNYLLELCIPINNVLHVEYDNEALKMQDLVFPEGGIIGLQLIQNDKCDSFLLSSETEIARNAWEKYQENDTSLEYYEIVDSLDNMSGSRLVCLIPQPFLESLIIGDKITFVITWVLVLLLVLLSAYIAVFVFTARLNKFLNNVNEKMNDILCFEDGNDSIGNDFKGIEEKVIQLVYSTKNYCSELEKYESENNRLELELLQMRLNPHLLYNTLTGIRCQIQDTTIRQSIDSLIRYYRIVLSKGHLIIRIEEEIKMIEEYLKLVIFTYQLSNVKFNFEVEDEARNFMIIKHLLQPIVENAVEHGIRAKKNEGNIWIRVKLSEKDVIIEIEDNGVGMTLDQIKGILTPPIYSSIGGGYGIYNVKQRIETYYGNEYGMSFHSKLDKGTLVVLRIPQLIESKENNNMDTKY